MSEADRELWYRERDKHLQELPAITQSEITDLELARAQHLSQAKRIQRKIEEARKRLDQHSGRS